MSYRFEAGESPGDALGRIADEELRAAGERLVDGGAPDPDAAVHRTRKGIKRLRTLLRLYRSALDRGVVARDNVRLRDAGRTLSAARDRRVFADTLGGLADRDPRLAAAAARALALHEAAGDPPDTAGAIASAASQLAAVRASLDDWRPRPRGWKGVAPGLSRIHRRALRTGARAFAATPADSELLHEFRKRVKDHWHALKLLEGGWPELMVVEAAEAKRLSDLLGDDHDLALLIGAVEASGRFRGRADLLRAAAARSAELRTAARGLAARLYAETPAAFVARQRAYRRSWRHESA